MRPFAQFPIYVRSLKICARLPLKKKKRGKAVRIFQMFLFFSLFEFPLSNFSGAMQKRELKEKRKEEELISGARNERIFSRRKCQESFFVSQLFRLGTPQDFAYIFLLPLRKHVDGDMNTAQIHYI